MDDLQSVIASEDDLLTENAAPLRDDAVQQRVQELASKAQSYLGRPTNANYKQALGLYERILAFSDLSVDQRAEFQRRLDETRAAYERFRAQFGELTTARQLQRDEVELIELRKLINAGVETGPDGEELEPQFDKLLAAVRDKLLRVGRELADQAGKQASDGADYLDPQLLDAAVSGYDQAARRVQGEAIQGGDSSPAANVAVLGIQGLLLNEAVQSAIKKYEQRGVAVRDARAAVQRIRPLYDEADEAFRRGGYDEAAEILETARELAGNHVSSMLVESLFRRSMQRWERVAITRADALLHAARIASSRGDYDQVERTVAEMIALEPHLDSDGLRERKAQAQELVGQIQQSEQRLGQFVADSGLARVRGDLAEAERLAREALVLRPGHKPAQQALDSVLTLLVSNSFRNAEDALAAPEDQRLQGCRDMLELQRQNVSEIAELPARKKLLDRLEDQLAQIKRALERLHDARDQEQRARGLLEKAQQQAEQERYADALATLGSARELDPLNSQIDVLENELRAAWADSLRRRAREFMEAAPPHPAAALECLNALRDLGMEDVGSTDLRRRAAWQTSKERGLTLLRQGAIEDAVEALKQTDLSDPESRAALADARCKEAQRLMNQSRWSPALEVLQQVDRSNAEAQALISRARAELLLDQAQGFFTVKVFDGAEGKLREAEREPLEDLPARIELMREQINVARTVFRRVQSLQQRAQDQFRRYRAHNDVDSLLEAIRTLDEALELRDLPVEDQQREALQKLRTEYQQHHQDRVLAERTRLISIGDEALKEERIVRIPDAIRSYTTALELSPTHQDSEAMVRLEQAREHLRHTRDKLADEAFSLLNLRGVGSTQRGIQLADVQALLVRIEEAQQVDGEQHRGLSDALLALREAARACEAADIDLRTARTHWLAARQNGDSEFHDATLDIQRALRYFEGVTYIHTDLDRNNPESLVRQLNVDREIQRQIANAAGTTAQALERQDVEVAAAAFVELARAEEVAHTTTAALAERIPGLVLPQTPAERYPVQYHFLRNLVGTVQDLMRQEQEAPAVAELRELIRRRTACQRLLERLDRDNRFGLR
jgi:hypothetical protein